MGSRDGWGLRVVGIKGWWGIRGGGWFKGWWGLKVVGV